MTFVLDMPELPEMRGTGRTRGENRIRGLWPGVPREKAVLKIAGTYQAIAEPTSAQLDAATEIYLGGHVNEVTAAQKTALEAAGFTVSEIPT